MLKQQVVRYGMVDEAMIQRFAATPVAADGPIWMVNLLKYRAIADYSDGRPPGISGRQADDLYAPMELMARAGATIAFVANVEMQLIGASPAWDRVAVVKYPSRRSFADMLAQPEYADRHVHKDAGLEHSVLIAGGMLIPPPLPAEAPAWDDVPHPPTPDDGPVVILHVIRFNEGGAESGMAAYQDAAGRAALPRGVRIAAWLGVEGTLIGDGRQWDQVRLNTFPSKAAFMAVVADPARIAAQREHRETAIADTFSFVLRPTLDLLTPRPG